MFGNYRRCANSRSVNSPARPEGAERKANSRNGLQECRFSCQTSPHRDRPDGGASLTCLCRFRLQPPHRTSPDLRTAASERPISLAISENGSFLAVVQQDHLPVVLPRLSMICRICSSSRVPWQRCLAKRPVAPHASASRRHWPRSGPTRPPNRVSVHVYADVPRPRGGEDVAAMPATPAGSRRRTRAGLRIHAGLLHDIRRSLLHADTRRQLPPGDQQEILPTPLEQLTHRLLRPRRAASINPGSSPWHLPDARPLGGSSLAIPTSRVNKQGTVIGSAVYPVSVPHQVAEGKPQFTFSRAFRTGENLANPLL